MVIPPIVLCHKNTLYENALKYNNVFIALQ